tara:strand:+ start:3221 stop:3508 length:288 start_codon:yes stop_codon:yes gene_type:complete
MTITNISKNLTMALVLLCSLSMEAATAQPGGGGGGGKRGGPPPEAFEACADKVSGDSCQVTGRRGEELQGTCVIPSEEDETLVCAPEGAPGGAAD